MKIVYLLSTLFFLLTSNKGISQTFDNISPAISLGNAYGYLVLADLDNDGDPEIILTGYDDLRIYNNSNGTFDNPISYPEFKGESQGDHTLDVGDIDRDGFIDVLESGGPNTRIFYILLNKNPGFTNVTNNYVGQLAGPTYLGDYEGDGDLDIIYSGTQTGTLMNRNGVFNLGPWLTMQSTWFAGWCDLDHDSKLDVLQSTGDSYGYWGTYLLGNGYPGMVIKKKLSIASFIDGASFADYDGDGDLDMLAKYFPSRIYNNVNGDFVDSGITFPDSKTIEFADINNDGLYDVIVGGMMTSTWQVFETGIYLNQGNGSFAKLDAQIPAPDNQCSAAIGDVDGDGDLDIATQAGVYRNNSATVNATPATPIIVGTSVSGSGVALSWQASTDDTTPVNGLTYNIAVRSETGTVIVPGHSLSTGKRQVFKIGNAFNNLSFNLSCLKQGTYYWKVQALDASYQGSAFSTEQNFTITAVPPVAPAQLTAKPVADNQLLLTWVDQSSTEDQFIILRKPTGASFDFAAIDTVAANTTQYLDSAYLINNTSYDYRVIASNCAYPIEFAAETSATTFLRAFVDPQWLNLGTASGTMVLLGDYDNDADLDMLLTYGAMYNYQTKLFRFDNNGYTDSGIQFSTVAYSATWIDYNNDGFLDVIFDNGKIYENIGGASFLDVTSNVFPVPMTSLKGASFGDYDNDGDEDLLTQSGIFENNGKGQFIGNGNIVFSGTPVSKNAWGDYDKDGDLDILTSKSSNCITDVVVYENQSDKTFKGVEFTQLTGVNTRQGDMEWGDFDNDGYPDVLIAGEDPCKTDGMTSVYHNNGNRTFSKVTSLVREVFDMSMVWGDYDNDGDLDIFSYGDPFSGASSRTRIYKNDNNRFKETNINYLLENVQYGTTALGDIDNDGDLDYVVLGEADYVTPNIIAYKNTYVESWGVHNTKPSAPQTLTSTVNSDRSVTLSWTPATDKETQGSGLTYNIYLIDQDDSVRINSYSAMNGYRKIPNFGNAFSVNNKVIKNLKPGTYRWAVQSIDKGYTGSVFSQEDSFVIAPITGIENDHAALSVSIYPNPTSNNVIVTLNRPENDVQIQISNSLGQRIWSARIDQSETKFDLSSLPAGLYIATITVKGINLKVQKIIKI